MPSEHLENERNPMTDFIYNIPNSLLFLLICVVCIIISLIVIRFVHFKVPVKFRYEQNQSVICISQLIGIIYAIVIGFIILYELNNFNKASEAETAEAKAMFAIFRMAHALPDPRAPKYENSF